MHLCYSNRVRVVVFNAAFNITSVISWWSFIFVEETGENHRPAASYWQTLSHNGIEYTSQWAGFELTTLAVIDTDYTGSCKSNYYTIMTTTALVSDIIFV